MHRLPVYVFAAVTAVIAIADIWVFVQLDNKDVGVVLLVIVLVDLALLLLLLWPTRERKRKPRHDPAPEPEAVPRRAKFTTSMTAHDDDLDEEQFPDFLRRTPDTVEP